VTLALDASFPQRTWARGRELARIHRSDRGVWWFSSDGTGRFDPVGVPDLGSCYLAAEDLGAFVEVFRTRMELDIADIERLHLSHVTLGRDLRLADLCARRALKYGVTAQLGADGDYEASQAFASTVAAVGFDGIRWWLRHDPAQKLVGIALFGPCGLPSDAGTARWPQGHARPLSDQLLVSARRRFGYRLLPRP
jgi:hypothetical protein